MLNLLRRLLVSTSAWKAVASELGGKFVPGKFLGHAQIELSHREWPIAIEIQSGEVENQEDNFEYTKVYAQAPLVTEQKLAMLRNWPGQGFASHMVAMIGQRIDLPALGEKCFAVAKDPIFAESVFADEGLIEALERSPATIKILVGGALLDWEKPGPKEVSLLTPGVLTDPKELCSMVDLLRAILNRLEDTDPLERF